MKKTTAALALAAATIALAGCSAAQAVPGPSTAPTTTDSSKVAPLLAAPETSTAAPLPQLGDETARSGYLAGVKKAVNAWRDGNIPADAVLLEGAAQACALFAQGMTYTEIGALAGEDEIQRTNGMAVAVYASRHLCTAYNTDKL